MGQAACIMEQAAQTIVHVATISVTNSTMLSARHCERSEAIHRSAPAGAWIASSFRCSQ
jgi:hypothetical protein